MLLLNINESKKEKEDVRKLCREVKKLADNYGVNFIFVTDGASITHNNGNKAITHLRKELIKWELENGSNPYEDWSK